MSRSSGRELLMLHAVRLLGFANSTAIAARFGTGHEDTLRVLRAADADGLVQHVAFADLGGWSLTDAGKAENERRLAEERRTADPGGEIPAVYREFLLLNARLLRAVTDWQIAPTDADRFAQNTHADGASDRRILDELATLGTELAPLVTRLSRILTRFDGYAVRYDQALQNAELGRPEWVDRTDVDSCHRVWFQLHEDLVATLGIDRRSEA
ncbi:MAG: transcriptional regulator [Pseudoclavibacter sp.]